jgi:hypothetical protein
MRRLIAAGDLRAQFDRLTFSLAAIGVPVDGWALTRWAPGDGVARYRVESDGGARTPLGSSYWVGSRAAYDALRAAGEAVNLAAETFTVK